jgi:hypothetical protein
MVLNATFNNISAISGWSVLLVEETGVPGENHRPLQQYSRWLHCILCILYSIYTIDIIYIYGRRGRDRMVVNQCLSQIHSHKIIY